MTTNPVIHAIAVRANLMKYLRKPLLVIYKSITIEKFIQRKKESMDKNTTIKEQDENSKYEIQIVKKRKNDQGLPKNRCYHQLKRLLKECNQLSAMPLTESIKYSTT